MGLFSFIGKALGSVAKIGLNVATGNIGGAIAQSVSLLHGSKAPMSGTPLKLRVLQQLGDAQRLRGNATQSMPGGFPVTGIAGSTRLISTNARLLRMSPVLPGGAVASRLGPVPASGGTPPASYSGRKSKRHRSRSSKRSSSKRSGRKRSGGGRKLKFGSPAWRKKYMKKSRRR